MWTTILNGRTETHATKREAVTRVRSFLSGQHAPICRHGHTYIATKER